MMVCAFFLSKKKRLDFNKVKKNNKGKMSGVFLDITNEKISSCHKFEAINFYNILISLHFVSHAKCYFLNPTAMVDNVETSIDLWRENQALVHT